MLYYSKKSMENEYNIKSEIFLPSFLLNDIEYDEFDQELQILEQKDTTDSINNEKYVIINIIFALYKLAHIKK